MNSLEALKILEFGGIGYTPDEIDEAMFTIKSALERKEKLEKVLKKYGCLDLSLIIIWETYSDYVENYKELYWNPENEYKCMVNETEFNLLKEMLK